MTLGGVGGSGREDSDVALVEAHLAGDPEAFGELFRRHRDRLWAVALRTTGNPEDAADALQEALISAFRRAESFRGDSAVTTWLHRIVVNACLDRLRRRKVRAADPLPDDLDEAAARGAVLAGPDQGPDPGPETHVLAGERRDLVLAALAELPPDQKAALVLVDMEGYPVAEAAEILEVPTGTVKSRCARGRARLAVLLSDLAPPGTHDPPDASHSGGPPRDPPLSRSPRTSERAIEGGEQA
jgi:RNA polymerase sigma-70 factor (ECF subfamily)